MRLCIVGCGQVADWHWRWLKAIDDIDDVVLVDTDRSQAEGLARLVGFTGRKTTICPIAAAAAAGVDLALILTPNHAHYPCAMPFV
ncbi:MAG TPA: Gfo/Idh/MocA family oxidoreductase, partial [Alphaproteobacteria bacterium]